MKDNKALEKELAKTAELMLAIATEIDEINEALRSERKKLEAERDLWLEERREYEQRNNRT